MASVGGSIQEVSFNGRNFAVAADAEVNRKIGGWENEVMANGDGTARLVKTRVPLSIEGLTVEIDDGRDDHEFLQNLSNLKDFFTLTITFASGVVYQGRAQIVSDLQSSSKNATCQVDLAGPGTLVKQ